MLAQVYRCEISTSAGRWWTFVVPLPLKFAVP
jgi:hypothetical protein